LYTQCPDCSTVFRVTAEALRAAQGRVRCGICSSGFDALENLSESPVARSLDEPPHEDTITVEELPGTEFIELSGAAQPGEDEPDAGDDLDQPDEPDEPDQPDGPDQPDELDQPDERVPDAATPAEDAPAKDQPDEAVVRDAQELPASDPLEGLPDTALEFHGSAEDLEKLFVPAAGQSAGTEPMPATLPQAIEEIASQDLSGIEVREEDLPWPDDAGGSFEPGSPAHVAAILASSSGRAGQGEGADLDRTDEYPVLVIEDYETERPQDAVEGTEPPGEPEAATESTVIASGDGGEEQEAELEAETSRDLETPAASGEPGTGHDEPPEESSGQGGTAGSEPQDETPLLIIPEELRRGPSATAADDLAAPLDLDEEAPRRWPLALAAALLLVVLGAQAVHHWRQDLVRDPTAGPWMLRAYHALGLELQPPVDLGQFELRQLGAASDPGQAGRIRVRASIVNHAPFAQPYPLLRLTLQDRFGSTIGARNLSPAEYLPGAAVDASGLLGASQRADAEVVFVDPGREAVGFELDVCTEGETGLRCSTDLPRNAS